MAKQINILRTIAQEINRGNTYINKEGLFVSPSKVEAQAQKQYMEDMKAGTLDMSITPVAYIEKYTSDNFYKASDMSDQVTKLLGCEEVSKPSESEAPAVTPSEPEVTPSEPIPTASEDNKTVSKSKQKKVDSKESNPV